MRSINVHSHCWVSKIKICCKWHVLIFPRHKNICRSLKKIGTRLFVYKTESIDHNGHYGLTRRVYKSEYFDNLGGDIWVVSAECWSWLTLPQCNFWGPHTSRVSSRRCAMSGRLPRTDQRESASQTWALRSTSWTAGWTGTWLRYLGNHAATPWIIK